jgi:Tfp pilus assembly protein PilV
MKKLLGTSIIEILIATAMISMAVIAALSLTSRSQSQSSYARNLAEATKYATQAADWIRTQRDTLGWTTINSKSEGLYCLNNFPPDINSLTTTGTCDDTSYIGETKFKRQMVLDKSVSGIIKINITVGWTEQSPREAKIEMELTQW